MGYGFRAYNDNGMIQISDEFKNYSIHQRGTAVTGSDGKVTISFSALDREPIVFLRLRSTSYYAGAYIDGMLKERGSVTLYAVDNNGKMASGVQIGYIIYRSEQIKSSDTYGLRVRTSNGEIAFDSGRIPLQVDAVVDDRTADNTATKSISYPSSLGNIWMQMTPDMSALAVGGGGYVPFRRVMRTSADGTMQIAIHRLDRFGYPYANQSSDYSNRCAITRGTW
jgi:hypothetical protein